MTGLVAVALGLGGCGGIHVPLGSDETPTGTAKRASRDVLPATAGLADSDWDVVVKAASGMTGAEGTIPWSNAGTGAYGTIAAVAPFKAKNGAPCRAFSTTLATYSGVMLYRAETCQGLAGEWEIVKVMPGVPAA